MGKGKGPAPAPLLSGPSPAGERREGVNASVSSDVQSVFKGKTYSQLQVIFQGIEGKIRAGGPNLDMGYWESLLQQLRAHMARARSAPPGPAGVGVPRGAGGGASSHVWPPSPGAGDTTAGPKATRLPPTPHPLCTDSLRVWPQCVNTARGCASRLRVHSPLPASRVLFGRAWWLPGHTSPCYGAPPFPALEGRSRQGL